MKERLFNLVLVLFSAAAVFPQQPDVKTITSDIDNFWKAYDKIISTKDSVAQYRYLNELYIEKGSEGLKHIMQVRNYTAKNYLDAINNYPLFWKSIRKNTFRSKRLSKDIQSGIGQLKKSYPPLQPATAYFTIGAFRTNGTVSGNRILIGAEMALADKSTITSELPDYLQYYYKTYNPIDDIVLLATHECIHTQQKPFVENLLSICLYEGVAEFVSVRVTGRPSYLSAIAFGKANDALVKAKFEQDMFKVNKLYDWLWSARENSFGMRDIGYYIGYAICEHYYGKAADKEKAIREMIELDYQNTAQFERFVDQSGYFSAPLETLYGNYEKSRPFVTGISQFENNSHDVSPKLTTITLNFSEPMSKENRGFDYGPLGEENVLRATKVIGFSEDGKSFTYEVQLEANKHYQSLVSNRFCNVNGIALRPYLIDIRTSD